MAFAKLLKTVFGDRNERIVKGYASTVDAINALSDEMAALDDETLRGKTELFRARLAAGESLDDLLPEAFAVSREVSFRVLGLRPYDVQMLGGIVLHQGRIAEMATGEGKTLTAVAPAYLNALAGDGVFIITVNDYLARRDCDWMGPVYAALGMTAGAIQGQMESTERQQMYACDLTFGTNNEFGFDYLRDNMKTRASEQVQAKLNFAIIDEVDSILVDEARTPLIISGFPEGSTQLYAQADRVARQMEEGPDFEVKEKERACVLSEEGIDHAQQLAGVESFYDAEHMEWPHHLEQALRAHYMYRRDKQYVIQDGDQGPEIVIVDEFTGRLMPGRRWSDGLHQAVEAKEGLRIREELQTLATITFQNYFRLYEKIAGMTGTALTEAAEFSKIYGLDVISVPPNKPIIREDDDDVIYRTSKEKWHAIADEIEVRHANGQPILVGTTTIENSEHLSGILKRRGVTHEVLNAKHHQREAEIVTQAGRKGAVTVATNMAGRGTDIVLGGNAEGLTRARLALFPDADPEAARAEVEQLAAAEHQEVLDAGGLYVIGTERHESRRIDNQLRGRSGRQGDPGKTRFYLSLQDDLMRIFARDWVSGLLEKLGMTEGQEIQSGMVSRGIEKAQKRVEARNFEIRKNLLEYDEVMDTQRKAIYGKRQEALEGDELRETILDMCDEVAAGIVSSRWPEKGEPDLDGIVGELSTRFNTPFAGDELRAAGKDSDDALGVVMERLERRYSEREESLTPERMRMLERFLLLNTIDSRWKDHLRAMDALKAGIGLRGYAQVDPKDEYKREGYDKFQLLTAAISEEVTGMFFRLEVRQEDDARLDQRWQGRQIQGRDAAPQPGAPAAAPVPAAMAAAQRGRARAANAAGREGPVAPIVRKTERVGRNDPCPCGSGKKYKRCCYPKYDS
ncbi:MAG: preprotein translocase subunit SecA [Planctomycetota bacterium]|nr:MAG: preprotein translocase subunit SecA [Planctomycetota bacterium]